MTRSATDEQSGGLDVGRVISEQQFAELKEAGVDFDAGMGGEVVKEMLKRIDLDTENKKLRKGLQAASTEMARTKIVKRLKVVESILKSTNKAECANARMTVRKIPHTPI